MQSSLYSSVVAGAGPGGGHRVPMERIAVLQFCFGKTWKKNQMLLTWRRTYDLWLLIRILYHLALGDLWELCFYKGHFTIVPLYFANRAPFLPLDPSLGRSSTLLLFSYTRLVMFSTEISFFLSGDSIVVAPSQTLSNQEYHMLRETALKVTSVNEQQSLLCSTHFPLRRTVRLAT